MGLFLILPSFIGANLKGVRDCCLFVYLNSSVKLNLPSSHMIIERSRNWEKRRNRIWRELRLRECNGMKIDFGKWKGKQGASKVMRILKEPQWQRITSSKICIKGREVGRLRRPLVIRQTKCLPRLYKITPILRTLLNSPETKASSRDFRAAK